MKTANIDSVADEIVNELIDAVLKNPFANKILGVFFLSYLKNNRTQGLRPNWNAGILK